jgi:hypothetical protein
MSADQWPDDVRLSDIEPRFVCKACGNRGAEIRPHFAAARMDYGLAYGPHVWTLTRLEVLDLISRDDYGQLVLTETGRGLVATAN